MTKLRGYYSRARDCCPVFKMAIATWKTVVRDLCEQSFSMSCTELKVKPLVADPSLRAICQRLAPCDW
jgi:hypothetical protein